MTPVFKFAVLSGLALIAGCSATTTDPVAVASPSMPPAAADALPPMMPVEELGSADVRPPITGSCGMEDLQQYVGWPRTSVSRNVLPANFRVLGPHSVTTMEYRAERLTVRIDANDRIESISCG